ncbi:hypothetical protein HNP84_006419 [Thermocatellispora tengchongensis]|uniref:Uncharacterized protein n=1 Tax=Thermocatellispora tengchongensis TaxID=1073253 RepID=A0A840PAJ8_9ACTN|nr:hypothetical protein [Thermocatellispora tengchongensis]MBB5136668.1 hypothetical protein [Thermocatellispora tengchongensis]
MYVYVTADHVELREPDDCRRFHVLTALDRAALDAALAGAGAGSATDAETDAEIDIGWVRSAAVGAGGVGGDWADRFAAMLAYAGRKGWLTADGRRVRAHVERP